ncbi:MAG: hypothetical protein ACM3JQ_01845 [Candidatus Eiseniibacteriota bacterium]
MNSPVEIAFIILLGVTLLSSFYLSSHQTIAKQPIPSRSKIVQDLKKKVAILLAPYAHVGNSTNPTNLLQCQAAMTELETFVETVSAEIAGFKGVIGEILHNIH